MNYILRNLVFPFAILIALLAVIIIRHGSASCTDPAVWFPLTTEDLASVLDDPHNRAIRGTKITYYKWDSSAQSFEYGNFSAPPRTGVERQWYFDYSTEGQRYAYLLASEMELKNLFQLVVSNEICEMQDYRYPPFNPGLSYRKIFVHGAYSKACIGYNTRTPESEPFWEVVDYIEANFVAPALQNPVEHWWWEEEE